MVRIGDMNNTDAACDVVDEAIGAYGHEVDREALRVLLDKASADGRVFVMPGDVERRIIEAQPVDAPSVHD